jgi:hypothetical protein
MSADMIHVLLTLRNQIKIYHWQTHKYSRHVATDGLTAKLDELIDTFVETYMGKYGRPKFTAKTGQIHLGNFTESNAHSLLEEGIHYMMTHMTKKLDAKKDTDLLNLRDEIVGELNKVRYLFTLA